MPGCAIFKIYDPYYGIIVDENTKKPIEGAVVLVKYDTSIATLAGAVGNYIDAAETVTDNEGRFSIPSNLVLTFRPLNLWEPYPYIFIAKPGYGCFDNMSSIMTNPEVIDPNNEHLPWWSLPARTPVVIALQKRENTEKKNQTSSCGPFACRPRSGNPLQDRLFECSQSTVPVGKMWEFEKVKYFDELALGIEQRKFPLNTELYLAIGENEYERVKKLIATGIGINVGQYTPLMYSAELGRVDIAELLIKSGAHIDAQDNTGKTALTVSISYSQVSVAKLMINKKANINIAEKWGATPLSIACSKGSFDIVELLLKKGASVSVKDDNGAAILAITRRVAKGQELDRLINMLHSYGAHE